MPRITACSTLAFSLSSLEVALEHIFCYGFELVEIAEMLTHSKHFPIDTVDPVEVRKQLDKYSLNPIAANVALATCSTDQPGLLKAFVGKQSSNSRANLWLPSYTAATRLPCTTVSSSARTDAWSPRLDTARYSSPSPTASDCSQVKSPAAATSCSTSDAEAY